MFALHMAGAGLVPSGYVRMAGAGLENQTRMFS